MASYSPMATALAAGRRSWLGFLLWMLLAGCGLALLSTGIPVRDRGIALLERAGLGSVAGVRETALVMTEPEDAAAFAAESVLGRIAPLSASPVDPIAVGPDTPSLLGGVQSLALDSLEGAPGGSQERVLVGRSAYSSWDLAREPAPGSARRWERALTLASNGAPGFEVATDALAAAYLGGWPRLSAEERGRARRAVTAAFQSPAFVQRALPAAVSALGVEDAARLLPNQKPALEAAASVLRALGQSAAAEQVARAAATAPSTGAFVPSIP